VTLQTEGINDKTELDVRAELDLSNVISETSEWGKRVGENYARAMSCLFACLLIQP
jgi:hypothetical protein